MSNFSTQTIEFLKSLPNSELIRLLSSMPRQRQIEALKAMQLAKANTAIDDDIGRKRAQRSEAARVIIPPVADPARRAACLADPELFLRTYNPKGEEGFTTPFAEHHLAMIRAIDERSRTGGDKAVAAPRGDGKSSVAVWMLIYIILAGNCRSAVIIAATRKHAQRLFKRFKRAFAFNDILAADFPEIAACVRDLDGAPQRAAKQHVDGQKTQIVWTQDEVYFPHVPGSPYGGVHVAFYGLDSAIRGGRFHFALIDDPETKAVAANEEMNYKIEEMIDSDVAGLAYPDSTITRVILTTVQNRRCYSYRVTDPKIKPSFAGERYGVLKSWPTNREMWDEYIALRKVGQTSGDKDGQKALEFFLANREAMKLGADVTNPFRFDKKSETEVCALQAFFNRVADWGLPRALAELQNDPEDEVTEDPGVITQGRVQSQISGFMRNELPRDDVKITVGLDIGKYASHWVKTAWTSDATGFVIDYGVVETPGASDAKDASSLEIALLSAMLQWGEEIVVENPPDFCLIDSGNWKDPVYEFVRRKSSPFAASKGRDYMQYASLANARDKRVFLEAVANYQVQEKVWLYNVNVDYWKRWVHARFTTPVMNEANQFNAGALSLFASSDRKQHLAFAHHICAEIWQETYKEGRGLTAKFESKSKNNHWLDAMVLSAAAAGVLGIRLLGQTSPIIRPVKAQPTQETQQPREQQQQARPRANFRRRQGGWIKGMRR